MGLIRRGRHWPELDGVRGIACLLVVSLHCFVGLLHPSFASVPSWAIPITATGADLLFVLSGFLIGGILLDHKGTPNFFKAFWARRAGRILPVYLLLITSYVVALGVSQSVSLSWLDGWLLREPIPLWSYLTFTQNYIMAIRSDPGAYWVGITWSLAIEEQFYLVFPILVCWLSRRTLTGIAVASLLAAALIRIWCWHVGGAGYSGYFPTPARIDTLMLGVLVAMTVRSAPLLAMATRLRVVLDIAAILLLCAYLDGRVGGWQPTLRYTLVAILFAYVILRIFIAPNGLFCAFLRNPALVHAGAISYAWYMYHQATNGLVHGFLFDRGPVITNYQQLATAGLVITLSGVLAALSTRFFERPFRALAHRVPYVPGNFPPLLERATKPVLH